MAQQEDDDKLIRPHFHELNNEIETKSEKWSLEAIHLTDRNLSFITSRLNNVRNSRLAINKLGPDILYIIFTLVVYRRFSETTALVISHVCHRWRELILQWSALWAFVDLNNSPSITDLFMKRSQNAPLTLKWLQKIYYYKRRPSIRSRSRFEKAPSKSYFVSHAQSILPRLCSLNVRTTYTGFTSLYQAIQDSISLSLQLRHLAIILLGPPSIDEDRLLPPPLTYLIDNSCLLEITLRGLDLPWLKLPHNRLTHFALNCPINPPALPQLLFFLSDCFSLKVLDLEIVDHDDYGIKTEFSPTTPTSLGAIQRLDLPNLTKLVLEARGPSSYDYIWQFAWCIRTLGALYSFELVYDLKSLGLPDETTTGSHPFQIFGAVPPGAFSHFSKYQFLVISFGDDEENLMIHKHTLVSDHHGWSDPPGEDPLVFMCKGFEPPINYSAIFELIYAMPYIRHLIIRFDAWRIFTLPNLDVQRAFSRLRTLAFTKCGTEALISLPAGFRVKRLILGFCTVSFDVLFDVVVSTGVEILELTECQDMDADEGPDEMISALRDLGVVVWVQHDDSESGESDESDESDE